MITQFQQCFIAQASHLLERRRRRKIETKGVIGREKGGRNSREWKGRKKGGVKFIKRPHPRKDTSFTEMSWSRENLDLTSFWPTHILQKKKESLRFSIYNGSFIPKILSNILQYHWDIGTRIPKPETLPRRWIGGFPISFCSGCWSPGRWKSRSGCKGW